MISVRAIEARDRDSWTRLFVAYGVFYETTFGDDVIDGVWRWLMDEAHEVKALVAEADDDVVGFAHYHRIVDTFTARTSWNLDDLYVSPAARGRGAGTSLIDAVIAVAAQHGGGTLRWITSADNVTAQSVYDPLAKRTDWVTYERETG